MTDNDRVLCAATARLLQASGIIAAWSLALAIASTGVLALTERSLASWLAFGAVLLLGLPERYLAFRLQLDAGLFSDLAQARIVSLNALDHALQRLNLRKSSGDEPRGLDDRVAGARRLLQRHGFLVVCQSVLFWTALLIQDVR